MGMQLMKFPQVFQKTIRQAPYLSLGDLKSMFMFENRDYFVYLFLVCVAKHTNLNDTVVGIIVAFFYHQWQQIRPVLFATTVTFFGMVFYLKCAIFSGINLACPHSCGDQFA